MGYVEASYAEVNDLSTVGVGTVRVGAVQVGETGDRFTEPSDYAAAQAIASARITGTNGDLRLDIDYRGTADYAYPLVVVTYELVCRTGTPALTRSFLAYAAGEAGQAALAGAGYAPLPAAARARVAQAVNDLR